jgi:hypothetical protein
MKIIKAMKMIAFNTSIPVWINPLAVQHFEEISFHGKVRTDVRFCNYSFVIEESTEWLALEMGR